MDFTNYSKFTDYPVPEIQFSNENTFIKFKCCYKLMNVAA